MAPWETIEQTISAHQQRPFVATQRRSVGGGCINSCWLLACGDREYFVKLNAAKQLAMFEAEAAGLQALSAAAAIRVPEPLFCGSDQQQSWLVMEALSLGGRGQPARLGERLAALHRHEATAFGWFRDNTIGSNPQYNHWHHDWCDFWVQQRLRPQLAMAQRGSEGARLRELDERLIPLLPALFRSYQPRPSLLHGDLWSGNHGWTRAGEPVLFDPAVYYGDRETDLAMTELFGGFDAEFYAAYQAAWPLDSGYALRKHLYNLYHILNHYNLFGGGYGGQAQRLLQHLLAELG